MLKQSQRNASTNGAITKLIEDNANAQLKEKCTGPFEEYVDNKVPHVTVSSASRSTFFPVFSIIILCWLAEPGYEATLSDLVQVTYKHVKEYFADASVASAIAQRVSPRVKIQASIA